MTQPLTMERIDEAFASSGVPALDSCIVAREQVAEKLDLAVTGLLTVVQAPVGAGKTTAAASWASGVTQARGLVWLGLDGESSRPSVFLGRLVETLALAGFPGMPTVTRIAQRSPARRRALLAAVADAIREVGTCVLVLDDFPTGTSGALGADLEFLLHHSGRALRVVILAAAQPAMVLHRLRMAGEISTITTADLNFDRTEIAGLLKQAGLEPRAAMVDEVHRHTHGWAAGVRLAVSALATQSTAEAMDEVSRTIDDYVVGEVLEPMPPDSRELVLRGSLVEALPLELAEALVGIDCELASQRAAASSAFVLLDSEGTIRLHPLLRSVATAQLRRVSPDVAPLVYRASAQWYADQGDLETAVDLAGQAGDWSWAAAALVESFAVPRLLDGSYSPAKPTKAVLDSDPLLTAAAALSAGNLALAQTSIRRAPPSSLDSMVVQASKCLVSLAIAGRTGDVSRGRELVASARELAATLPLTMSSDASEFARRIDAAAGLIELLEGRVHQASITLHRAGARAPLGDVVRRDALGHQALIDAMQGNLASAASTADDVMVTASRFGGDAGVGLAHLASAWVHTDRAELSDAKLRLQGAAELHGHCDQLPVVASKILQARVLVAEARPEAALRVIASLQRSDQMPEPGWLADLVRVQLARALIALGEPRRALAAVTPEPEYATVEGRVVAAHARLDIGDVRGARALLQGARSDLGQAALGIQVETWMFDARLAFEADDAEQARLLVDRALRAAAPEELRSSFVDCAAWLRCFMSRDPTLQRAHRDFFATLDSVPVAASSVMSTSLSVSASRSDGAGRVEEQVFEPLTDRECQVLELLAMMCSTEEIASQLFVSGNTVKTHVKGIFRKLGVNRRVDAVRTGRSLGLC